MKSTFVSFFVMLFISVSFAQKTTVTEDSTLNGQFNKIYRISTTYQTYKVIDIDKFQKLKANVLDSIEKANKEISTKENLLKHEQETVQKLNVELSKVKDNLSVALQKENSISLFGLELTKATYNIILWIIILILSSSLGYFIFKFTRSNILTKKAEKNLVDVEQEFENHRKKSLEREQKLRRKLQDEINKQRNS